MSRKNKRVLTLDNNPAIILNMQTSLNTSATRANTSEDRGNPLMVGRRSKSFNEATLRCAKAIKAAKNSFEGQLIPTLKLEKGKNYSLEVDNGMVFFRSTALPNLKITLGSLEELKQLDLVTLEHSIRASTRNHGYVAFENTARMNGHALASSFGVPTTESILREKIPTEQLQQIYEHVGEEDLLRIIAERAELEASNDGSNNYYNRASDVEREHLTLIKGAIEEVTGAKPWIIGFASEFAESLLKIINPNALTHAL
jgi:hypothetical protein